VKGLGISLLPMNSPHAHVKCGSQVIYNSLFTSLGGSDMVCDQNAQPPPSRKMGEVLIFFIDNLTLFI